MWRFDLIVTATVMMMHMYLHLGGPGVLLLSLRLCLHLRLCFFFFFSGLRASVRREVSVSKAYYSLAALHGPI